MKPAPFHSERPDTRAAALALLAQNDGDTKILAGGQSLVPMMNFRLAKPERLIDVDYRTELGDRGHCGDHSPAERVTDDHCVAWSDASRSHFGQDVGGHRYKVERWRPCCLAMTAQVDGENSPPHIGGRVDGERIEE